MSMRLMAIYFSNRGALVSWRDSCLARVVGDDIKVERIRSQGFLVLWRIFLALWGTVR